MTIVADQVATRFGMLGRELSHAVLQTIALTARDGVKCLGELQIHLGLAEGPASDTAGHIDAHWRELLGNLFPTSILVVDTMGSASPGIADLPATPEEERAIRRILTAAASFLLTESLALEERLEWWSSFTDVADDQRTELYALAERATAISSTLLDHAEGGTWRNLAADLVRTPAATASIITAEVPKLKRPRIRMVAIPVAYFAGPRYDFDRDFGNFVLNKWLYDQPSLWADTRVSVVMPFGTRDMEPFAMSSGDGKSEPYPGFWVGFFDVIAVPMPTPPRIPRRIDAESAALTCLLTSLVGVSRAQPADEFLVVASGIPLPDRVDFYDRPEWAATALAAKGLLPNLRGSSVSFIGVDAAGASAYLQAVCIAAGADDVRFERPSPDALALAASAQSHPRVVMSAPTPNIVSGLTKVVGDWGRTMRSILLFVVAVTGVAVLILATGHSGIGSVPVLATVLAMPFLYRLVGALRAGALPSALVPPRLSNAIHRSARRAKDGVANSR